MISVIITNYNGLSILKQCLSETYQILTQVGISDIILADDASSDDSVAYVQDAFPSITIATNKQNGGFAANCNHAATYANHKLLFFLNNDMVVKRIDPKTIITLFQSPRRFACSPRIERHIDADTLINETPSRGRFDGGYLVTSNGEPADYNRSDPVPILWGCGGALIVRKDYFDDLNGFSTLFSRGYSEDLDLCYRAWKLGLDTQYDPRMLCYHYHQSTFKKLFSKNYLAHLGRKNYYIMLWRNLTDWDYIMQHILAVMLRVITLQVPHIWAILCALRQFNKIRHFRRSFTPLYYDKAVLALAHPDAAPATHVSRVTIKPLSCVLH